MVTWGCISSNRVFKNKTKQDTWIQGCEALCIFGSLKLWDQCLYIWRHLSWITGHELWVLDCEAVIFWKILNFCNADYQYGFLKSRILKPESLKAWWIYCLLRRKCVFSTIYMGCPHLMLLGSVLVLTVGTHTWSRCAVKLSEAGSSHFQKYKMRVLHLRTVLWKAGHFQLTIQRPR